MARLNLLLPLLLTAPLAAQTAGTWKLAADPDIPGVIEKATEPMNIFIRPIARARLRKTNPAYTQIVIERTGTEIVITYDQRAPQHMPATGEIVNWKREDGEVFKLSGKLEGNDLIQTYTAEDGQRTNVFHVDPNTGGLSMAVTLTSHRLPKPVVYAVAYKH